MRKLLAFAGLCLASLLLYVAVFSVVHRPLTLGEIPRLLAVKRAYASSLPSPKLLILAGSGGRYSHRCAAITQATHWPCANLSLAVGIALDFVFEQADPVLQAKDVVYLPLEYEQYRATQAQMAAGSQNPVLVHDLREQLWRLPAERIARAYASFDLPFLVHGLIEMGLAGRGFERRTNLASLTPEGDEQGHTEEKGRAYEPFRRSARFDTTPLPAQSHALEVLDDFLDRMHRRGVRVIGGLPTTPDDVALDDAAIERLRARFARHGQTLLVLPNRSQYPLGCFFDSLVHLNEGCQWQHSALLGKALSGLLPLP